MLYSNQFMLSSCFCSIAAVFTLCSQLLQGYAPLGWKEFLLIMFPPQPHRSAPRNCKTCFRRPPPIFSRSTQMVRVQSSVKLCALKWMCLVCITHKPVHISLCDVKIRLNLLSPATALPLTSSPTTRWNHFFWARALPWNSIANSHWAQHIALSALSAPSHSSQVSTGDKRGDCSNATDNWPWKVFHSWLQLFIQITAQSSKGETFQEDGWILFLKIYLNPETCSCGVQTT